MSALSLPHHDASLVSGAKPVVIPAWTDYNDHFNVAYYVQALDQAIRAFRESVEGLPALQLRCNKVAYLREVHGGRRLSITTQILSVSTQGIHFLQGLYAEPDGYLAAIEERVVDFATDASGMPVLLDETVFQSLSERARQHASFPVPDGWGGLC